MATTDSAENCYHGTLDGSAADTITMKNPSGTLTFVNRGGTAAIYFRVDGVTAAVVAAKENFILPAAISSLTVRVTNPVFAATPVGVTCSIISAAAAPYSIEVI